MKVLLLADEVQVQHALARRFQLRERECLLQTSAQLFARTDLAGFFEAEGIGILLDTASASQVLQSPCPDLVDREVRLAHACEAADIPLLFISSSRVFDGIDGGRNREDDQPGPASREGALFWQLEEAVRVTVGRHLILRTMPLFSEQPGNVLTELLLRFEQGKPFPLSSSGRCSPLHCEDFSRVVSGVVDQLACGADVWGTYHYGSSDPVSNYQFAETVLAVVRQYTEVDETLLQRVETADSRWPNPLLNCDKIHNTFGIKQLPWRASIASTLKRLFTENDNTDHPEG